MKKIIAIVFIMVIASKLFANNDSLAVNTDSLTINTDSILTTQCKETNIILETCIETNNEKITYCP